MWLFTVFYGFTFAIGGESQNSDIVRYLAEIPILYNLDLNLNGILTYYSNSGEVDILRTFLAFMVAYFTNDGFFLIAVFGIIYGFFFSRNMWYILDRLEGKIKFFVKILLVCLFLVIPIWNLNGFRFWTASHVFLYGLLPYLFERKKRSLIWCFITPFIIHYSFLIALIPLLTFIILGNKVKLYYILLIISLFMSEINISKFNNVLESYAPTTLVERSKSYRNEGEIESLREDGIWNESTVWYVKYYNLFLKFTLVVLLLAFYWTFRKPNNLTEYSLRLFGFVLLFYAFANIISTIPSGGRFLSLANLLALSFCILYLQNQKIKRYLNVLSKLTTPFLLFFIIIVVRISWYSFSIMTILGNPITAIFTFGDNVSLNDIIKGL